MVKILLCILKTCNNGTEIQYTGENICNITPSKLSSPLCENENYVNEVNFMKIVKTDNSAKMD